MSTALRVAPIAVDARDRGSKNGAMTKDQLRQFGEQLRARRAKLDWNKAKFCQVAGITPNTLRALERGAQQPNADTLDRLANALNTTVAALTSGRRTINTTDPLYAQLNDEDLEIAQAFHHAPIRVRQRTLGVLQERNPGRAKEPVTRDADEWARRLLALAPEKRQVLASLIAQFQASTEEGGLDEATLEMARRLHALPVADRQAVGQLIARFEQLMTKSKKKDHASSRYRSEVSPEGTPVPRKPAAQ